MRKSLEAEASFGLYYGASNNRDCPWDISNARAELGFEPEDNGSMLK
jgi:hypothetical protein